MIKKIVKNILNVTIYPSNEEFQKATEDFLSSEYPDYLKKFKKDRWVTHYETVFYPQVSLKTMLLCLL